MKSENYHIPIPPQVEEWIAQQPASEQEVYRKLWHDTGKIAGYSSIPDGEADAGETAEAWSELSNILFDFDKKSGPQHLNGNGGKEKPGPSGAKTKTGIDVAGNPKLSDRINHAGGTAKGGQTIKPVSRIRPIIYLAAAAVVTMAISLGYFFYINSDVSVHAPYGQQISYVFSDGSSVDLNSGSSLQFRRNFETGQRHVTLHGEAFFEVEGDARPFIVETHNAMVRVTGTRFNIRARSGDSDNETSVLLAEGGLEFIPRVRPDNSIFLKPGEISRLKELSERPTEPEEAAVDSFLAWRTGGLFFNDQPLSHIFSEIERRFDARIDVDHESVKDQRFSVLYSRPESAERILRDICEDNQLNLEIINGNRFHIY